jgi:hypothetical protein
MHEAVAGHLLSARLLLVAFLCWRVCLRLLLFVIGSPKDGYQAPQPSQKQLARMLCIVHTLPDGSL